VGYAILLSRLVTLRPCCPGTSAAPHHVAPNPQSRSCVRFFPEPDIPSTLLPREVVERWAGEMEELPSDKRKRYQGEYGLDAEMARVLTDDMFVSEYFEATVSHGAPPAEAAK